MLTKYISNTIIALMYTISVVGQSITINSTDYKQTISMIGGDMERSSIAIQSSLNKQEMIEWAFKDIAFNTCRVQYDKNQELVEGTKNWSFYTKQIATMQAIKAISPNIKFFATMRSDYDGFGNENNLPDWICNYATKAIDANKYGIFLADYVEYMSQQGVPIAIMSVAKEWSTFVKADVARDVINKLNSECTSRGIAKPLISDQGFWSLSQGITYMNKVNSIGTKNLYSSFSTHNYANEDAAAWSSFIATATALGIPVVDDETSTGSGAATSGVEPDVSKPVGVYKDKCITYNAGLQGEILFEIWSRGINTETRSIYCPWKGTGTRLRGYYIMKQFANNILDSKYITSNITSLPSFYTMAFRKDDKIVLWVINKSTTAYTSIPISVDGSEINGSVAVNYWTNATPITGSTNTIIPASNSFNVSIDATSLNCYIFNVNTVSKIDQTITFAALPAKTVGDADFAPGATTSSGLTVSYTSSNTAVATIVNGNIHIVGEGTAIITASQAGDAIINPASVEQSLTVTLANVVAIGSIKISDGFKIYPNPVTNILHIDSSDGSMAEIYNTFGVLVFKNNNELKGGLYVDMSSLNSGIYFIRITNNGLVTNKKVIKQ